MFYKLRRDTFVRNYEDIGYIVNKTVFADWATDKSGMVFLNAISREPKSLDEITEIIAASFVDADIEKIKNDAVDFFTQLEKDGFVVSGDTKAVLEQKDSNFSYSKLLGNPAYKNLSLAVPDTDTQTYLGEHFKETPRLVSLHIELTSRCNERCIHCYIPHEKKNTDIDTALFYDVLEQCREIGVLDLTFSGGEPLLHPHFCGLLRKAKGYDFSVTVLSNLTLLNDEIISIMKKGVLSSVNVSLYSMIPEIHDSITKLSGSFAKTKEGILKLIDNNIPVQINCPIMKENKDSFVDVFKWGHEHKCRVMVDYMIMARSDHSIDNLHHRITPEDVGSVIGSIINNDVIYQHRVLSSSFDALNVEHKDISNDVVCGVCISYLCMIANGDIYPCPGWQGYIAGNIKQTPLKEIWENSPKVKYLRNLRRKDFPQCLDCKDRGFCALCMGRNANESNGDIFKINDHFCKVAAINRKVVMDWKAKHQGGEYND